LTEKFAGTTVRAPSVGMQRRRNAKLTCSRYITPSQALFRGN